MYFIGIGGIGMSALAKYFHLNGRKISGYDKTPSAITDELMSDGIEIHFEENIDRLPKQVDLVVYTPAVPAEHKELVYYRNHNYQVVKRSDLLEELTKNKFTIAVAGTHGKTTTTSMIAHILRYSGYDCTAFIGGISANYNTNVLIGRTDSFVVEADEFDRSFLKIHPDIAVITSCDADHLDIYGTREEVEKAYGNFANNIKPNGILITKKDLPFLKYTFQSDAKFYAISEQVEFKAENIRLVQGTYSFDLLTQTESISGIHLMISGYHNVENAVAAGAVASELKIEGKKIRDALNTFKGVKRRFEMIYRDDKTVFIDDYAHHPQEIKAFLKSVREIYPDKKITGIFQPHLYSRTHDFEEEFAAALSLVDELIVLPIYPARELPIPGVSSEMLLKKISLDKKMVCEKNQLIGELRKRNAEVLLTIGAGDIDQLVEPIREMLEERGKK